MLNSQEVYIIPRKTFCTDTRSFHLDITARTNMQWGEIRVWSMSSGARTQLRRLAQKNNSCTNGCILLASSQRQVRVCASAKWLYSSDFNIGTSIGDESSTIDTYQFTKNIGGIWGVFLKGNHAKSVLNRWNCKHISVGIKSKPCTINKRMQCFSQISFCRWYF